MKVLVLSDSHGRMGHVYDIVHKLSSDVAQILFLGDCTEDMDELQVRYPAIIFHIVAGNCDFNSSWEKEKLIKLSGKKIFMAHGDTYGVKLNYDRIIYKALEVSAEVCLWGHTHSPVCFYEEGILCLNPGSISFPRGRSGPSYGILDLSGDVPKGSIVAKQGKFFKPLL